MTQFPRLIKPGVEILQLKIDPGAVDINDMEFLEDLICASFNDAGRKIREKLKGKMAGFAGQFIGK